MTTLTDFILARLSEDEAVARRCETGPPVVLALQVGLDHSEGVDSGWVEIDPARVLRDVEAKRRIVEIHTAGSRTYVAYEGVTLDVTTCPRCRVWGEPEALVLRPGMPDPSEALDEPEPCETLRALALSWSDHPDYREEWRP